MRLLFNIGTMVSGFILLVPKENTLLQKLAGIGVAAVSAITAIILYAFLCGFTRTHVTTPGTLLDVSYPGILANEFSHIQMARWEGVSLHIQALGSILFCFVNHQLVFPACKQLRHAPARVSGVLVGANIGETVVYLLIGCCGYVLLAQHGESMAIEPLVLSSIPIWQMTMGKLLMVVALYLSIPLNLFPARTVLLEALAAGEDK